MRMLEDMAPAPVLVYVGDGEMMNELRALLPNAHFTGFVNQSALPAYYAMADVFVLPSEKEPWGLAVNEAMACATPVVVSDQVGAAADLVDGKSGIVFESGNAAALAVAIRSCLQNVAEMGACAARKIATWDFDADIKGLKQALASVKRPQ
jgi:glycosyltransferase involved in cell wall biosynthesis